jgi:hypothetical protein
VAGWMFLAIAEEVDQNLISCYEHGFGVVIGCLPTSFISFQYVFDEARRIWSADWMQQ